MSERPATAPPIGAPPLLRARTCLHTGRFLGARAVLTRPENAARLSAALAALTPQPGALLLAPAPARLGVEAAAQLDAQARAQGWTPATLSFDLDERGLIAGGVEGAETLRACGWRLALRADPACPLPFGARARSLYQELILKAEGAPRLFQGIEGFSRTALDVRLQAAREAGLALAIEDVTTAEAARGFAAAGFDVAEGAFAAAAREPWPFQWIAPRGASLR